MNLQFIRGTVGVDSLQLSVGGFPVGGPNPVGATDVRRGRFSEKTDVKMKELGPGGRVGAREGAGEVARVGAPRYWVYLRAVILSTIHTHNRGIIFFLSVIKFTIILSNTNEQIK